MVKMGCWKALVRRTVQAVVASLLVAAWVPVATSAEITHRLQGRAVHVMDGDTLRLRTDRGRDHTIRLASVDAPEVGREPRRPGQPYSQAARRALEQLVDNRRLSADCYEQDAYGRDICDLRLPDGRSVNRELVRTGMVWANMEKRGLFLRDPIIRELEDKARAARQGLWRDRSPVAPWQWRYHCWREHRCQ